MWDARPVIRIDFSRYTVNDADRLEQVIEYYIEEAKRIRDKLNYHKYRLHNKPLTLVSANFTSNTRTVDDWASELDKKAYLYF